MTDFELEVLDDVYGWAIATDFYPETERFAKYCGDTSALEADQKEIIDAYWKDYFGD